MTKIEMGADTEFLINGPITPALIGEYITSIGQRKNVGGHSLFLGQVRDDTVGERKVEAIEYSAYEEMVAAEAERIREVTQKAFSDVVSIEILHAVGMVKCGEISLFVLVTAGHRDQAIRACSHVVEMIKLNYPVWKKEIFNDDSHRWRENKR